MHVCLAVYALERAEIHKDGKKCYDQREHAKVFRSISSVPITLFFYTHVRQPHTFVDAFWEKAEKVPRSRH